MYITSLQFKNFRNYKHFSIELERGLSLVIGKNAQGKSNFLEGIYLLSTMRSSRASSDTDLVHRDALEDVPPVAKLMGTVERAAGHLQIELAVIGQGKGQGNEKKRPGKRARLNGLEKRISDVVGQLSSVLFTTGDIDILAGPPLIRRRYLDMMISQVDRSYLRAMQRYQMVLTRRNRLLKQVQIGKSGLSELGFWDHEIAHVGGILLNARKNALIGVQASVNEYMRHLSDQHEEVTLRYRPAIGPIESPVGTTDSDQWAACLLDAKDVVQKKEIETGTTQIGPHRDEIEIRIGNLPAGAFASRAQLRTAALALRLAESNYLRQSTGDDPVVLLDDVLSELDEGRRENVLEYVKNFPQTIVTTTDEDRVKELKSLASNEFKISRGKISRGKIT